MDGLKTYCLVVFVLVYAALIIWKRRRTEALWIGVIAASRARCPLAARGVRRRRVERAWGSSRASSSSPRSSPTRACRCASPTCSSTARRTSAWPSCSSASSRGSSRSSSRTWPPCSSSRRSRWRRPAGPDVSPVPFLIGIAVSSNLQGAGTLIGDPPSMILASFMRMNFNDFFFYQGKPSIFWAVQVGALASSVVLWLLFRRHRQPVAVHRARAARVVGADDRHRRRGRAAGALSDRRSRLPLARRHDLHGGGARDAGLGGRAAARPGQGAAEALRLEHDVLPDRRVHHGRGDGARRAHRRSRRGSSRGSPATIPSSSTCRSSSCRWPSPPSSTTSPTSPR